LLDSLLQEVSCRKQRNAAVPLGDGQRSPRTGIKEAASQSDVQFL